MASSTTRFPVFNKASATQQSFRYSTKVPLFNKASPGTKARPRGRPRPPLPTPAQRARAPPVHLTAQRPRAPHRKRSLCASRHLCICSKPPPDPTTLADVWLFLGMSCGGSCGIPCASLRGRPLHICWQNSFLRTLGERPGQVSIVFRIEARMR